MKQIMIIGASNSQHTVNFINTLLIDNSNNLITIFNTEYKANLESEIKAFYTANNVKIVNTHHLSNTKNGKIKAAFNLVKMARTLHIECRKSKQFDMCFVLYCSWQSSIWITQYNYFFKKVILVYFGSDVLRNKKLNNHFFNKMNKTSDCIIMPNLNTQRFFSEKTEGKYECKTHVIQYPKKMVSTMLAYEPLHNKIKDREYFDLPVDKIIILCGHTATTAEQYELMIKALSKCNKIILDKCYFVFMMTYAPGNPHEYQNKIEALLVQSNLNGKILKSRINYEDMPKLHYACDVHITTIKTDAFSCFLQEEMLAGNILIYGSWLNYYEIENDSFYTFSINSLTELSDTLEKVIDDFDNSIDKSKINISGIKALASESSIRNEWLRIVFKN